MTIWCGLYGNYTFLFLYDRLSVQVDPRKILEEGLRKELVRKISEAMHETLVFREATSGGNAGAEVRHSVVNKREGVSTPMAFTPSIPDPLFVFGKPCLRWSV